MRIFLAAILLSIASGAAAKVGDKAWAQCVWASDPEAAQSWLGMELPNWQSDCEATQVLLGFRLIALCSEEAANEVKVNREPNWKRMNSALSAAGSSRTGSAQSSFADAFLCRNFADGALFLNEFVRRSAERDVIVHRQYFADYEGAPSKMPQDLRVLPEAGVEQSRECLKINSAGELLETADDE